jgi:hypothetical protein
MWKSTINRVYWILSANVWLRYFVLLIALAVVATFILDHYGVMRATVFQRQTTDAATYTASFRNFLLIYATATIGPVGLFLAIGRTILGRRQAETAERGERNSRFQIGAQMLGNETLAVRLGGIYTLKALAQNDPETYLGTITDLMSAIVRTPPYFESSTDKTTPHGDTANGIPRELEPLTPDHPRPLFRAERISNLSASIWKMQTSKTPYSLRLIFLE